MIDISNVKIVDDETFLFISAADKDEITWLLEKTGAREDVDFKIYPRNMILNKQVSALIELSDEDKRKELEKMYGKKRAEVMMNIASVLVSHYDKEDLFQVLKPIIVDDERDADYKAHYWRENEKYQQEEWPVE